MIVTNLNGCVGKDTVVISTGTAPTVALGADIESCQGVTTTLDAGNTGSTFSWSTGESTQTITVSTSGTYSVDVTNPSGCTASDAINVNVNASPLVTVPSINICDGDAAATFNATAANAITYLWSGNGSGTSATITGTAAGDYTVQVTDINGCLNSATGTLTVNALPIVSVDDRIICQGGGVSMIATAPTATTYLWSNNGSGTNSATTAVTAGNYTVAVTDANGCTNTTTGVLTVNANPIVTVDGGFQVNYDILDGNVPLAFGLPSGGTYSGTGVVGGLFNTTSAGNGSHVVTYNYPDPITGCSSSTTNTLTVSTTTWVAGINSDQAVSVSPNPFNGHLNVSITPGSSNGTYRIVDGSGKLVLSGSLRNETLSINTGSLSPGMYYLTITSNGEIVTMKVVKSK